MAVIYSAMHKYTFYSIPFVLLQKYIVDAELLPFIIHNTHSRCQTLSLQRFIFIFNSFVWAQDIWEISLLNTNIHTHIYTLKDITFVQTSNTFFHMPFSERVDIFLEIFTSSFHKLNDYFLLFFAILIFTFCFVIIYATFVSAQSIKWIRLKVFSFNYLQNDKKDAFMTMNMDEMAQLSNAAVIHIICDSIIYL